MHSTPSVRPAPNFNANQDAATLQNAMEGNGCDNAKVISVLCARSNCQRQEIAKAFNEMYGENLKAKLKSELQGDFQKLILAILEPPSVYDAQQLHQAMEGLGTNESLLIEVMTTRSNEQIAEIRRIYKQLYHRELREHLIGDTSRWFQYLLVCLCSAKRDESNFVDHQRAHMDALRLYNAGARRLGTDESCFINILTGQNFSQLFLVFEEYNKMTNNTIDNAIKSEFSGHIRDGLLAIVEVARSRPAYFAKLLHKSMKKKSKNRQLTFSLDIFAQINDIILNYVHVFVKGLSAKHNDLIRLVVSRCECDMSDIRREFKAMYGTSLESMIDEECSGAYKDCLIALVRGETSHADDCVISIRV